MSIQIPKKAFALFFIVLLSILGIVIFGEKNSDKQVAGTQVVGTARIFVKAGYDPREVILPANQQNVIQFVTENSYDCSASLVIPKLQIEQFLPPTGTTNIDIPPQAVGTEIIAGCSMGMYTFKIKFI